MKSFETSASETERGRNRDGSQRSTSGEHLGKGVKIEIRTTINRPRQELFAFWRNFENLPHIMDHIQAINCLDDDRSHWQARRRKDNPNNPIEWDAQIINERANEMISWRTLEGSDVQHAGSIWFLEAPDGIGTEVKLVMEYDTSSFADFLAKLVRRSPTQQVREDLRHFKQIMEAGEVPTTAGQSAGRTEDMVAKYQEAK